MSTRSHDVMLGLVTLLCACSRREKDIAPAPERQRDGAPVTVFDVACDLDPSGIVARDATLPKGCTMVARYGVSVTAGATLTIEEGVTVAFGKVTSLRVIDGTIVAHGSEAEPIVFTSAASPKKDADWIGVVLEDRTHGGSVLDGVVIEYAGRGPDPAALKVVGSAKVSLGAITMQHDDGAGIAIVPAPPPTHLHVIVK